MEHEHASFMETFGEYGEKCERLTKEVASWKAIAEGYQKQFEDCAEDRARLTEENERLRDELDRTEKALIALDKAHNALFTDTFRIEAETKADTVREMQEKVEEKILSINPNLCGLLPFVDQIAKEMLEGG
jgi:chromosome segregation ATPase